MLNPQEYNLTPAPLHRKPGVDARCEYRQNTFVNSMKAKFSITTDTKGKDIKLF